MFSCKQFLILVTILLTITVDLYAAGKKTKKLQKNTLLRERETNPINFIRLVAMRIIYGIATRIGFGENISEALNGIFVPPGVDDYDDYSDFELGSDY